MVSGRFSSPQNTPAGYSIKWDDIPSPSENLAKLEEIENMKQNSTRKALQKSIPTISGNIHRGVYGPNSGINAAARVSPLAA